MSEHRTPLMARRHAAGFALVEALVALLIVSLGALALLQMHWHLERSSAEARSRAQAALWAQAQTETLQAAATPGALPAAGGDAPAPGMTRQWAAGPLGWAHVTSVSLAWTDRSGQAHEQALRALATPSDDAHLALLVSPLHPEHVRLGAEGRSLGVPPGAATFAARWARMALPAGDRTAWWVFDVRSGDAAWRCDDAPSTARDLQGCTAVAARSVSGTLHWDSSMQVRGARLVVGSDAWPCRWQVHAAGRPAADYLCLAPVRDHDGSPRTPPVWSGSLSADVSTADGSLPRWCRYAHNAASRVGYDAQYDDVAQPLFHQNYVLSLGDCPAGTLAPP
jgi:Tfp pilus assembly protein PilE